ncbi:MAG: hypothetical protein K5829_01620 [Treponema sp.]|nr:hypothetical protein [Treponema sp.]
MEIDLSWSAFYDLKKLKKYEKETHDFKAQIKIAQQIEMTAGMEFFDDTKEGYENNELFKKEMKKAEEWYKKAAESDEGVALLNLGLHYFRRMDLTKEEQENAGFDFIKRAAYEKFDEEAFHWLDHYCSLNEIVGTTKKLDEL